MKQKYVKPMIECENFVSNEYVSNCYVISDDCNHIGDFYVKNVDNKEEALNKFDSFYEGRHISDRFTNTTLFFGSLNGNVGSSDGHSTSPFWSFLIDIYNLIFDPDIDKIGVHHDLSVTQTSQGDNYPDLGPNAS